MGTAERERVQPPDFFKSIAYNGKILAQNSGVCMESGYTTAYNLGAGDCRWPGWISVDMSDGADLKADLRALPILSDSADAVAAIHVIEHFYAWEVFDILTEWKRILKPGGKLILELPCLDKVFGYIAQCVEKREPLAPFMTLYALYGDPHHRDVAMCHKFGWFTEHMREMLELVGMREINNVTPRYHHVFRDMRWECVK